MGAGIIGGLGLILVEILYHKHKIRKEKRADAAHMAITRWKGTIEVKKILRKNTVFWWMGIFKQFKEKTNKNIVFSGTELDG